VFRLKEHTEGGANSDGVQKSKHRPVNVPLPTLSRETIWNEQNIKTIGLLHIEMGIIFKNICWGEKGGFNAFWEIVEKNEEGWNRWGGAGGDTYLSTTF